MMLSSPPSSKVFCAPCPFENCCGLIFYVFGDAFGECSSCETKHKVDSLLESSQIQNFSTALAMCMRLMANNSSKPVGSPVTKVLGLSSYYCKLLSPLLTCYGIDKTGKAKTLRELKNCATFDCSWLGSRGFCIEPEHVDVPGYGRDESGSAAYLSGTLSLLRSFNNGRDSLIPLHVDGDGHCLVHAVSRAIVGRELFWHPLRTGLKLHLQENLPQYKALLCDFINSSEWDDIIAESDPEYAPEDNEMHGLRNVHIFGLCNVLQRPILLVDSVAGMQSSGDYSALFLPKLVRPSDCRDSSGSLNKPICLAWSSSGRNHYIPLIGIRGCDPPKFPRSLLPKVWGISQSAVKEYIEFDHKDCLDIGGKALPDTYLLKLTSGIAALYRQKNGVDPSLVADVYYSNFKKSVFGMQPQDVLVATKTALSERRLYRCISCTSVNLQPLSTDWLRPQGLLYNLAKKQTKGGMLEDQHVYNFHNYGVSCVYNARKDVLVVEKSTCLLEFCSWCNEAKLRLIHINGNTVYENGDRTATAVESSRTRCDCGFKHWYNGREYDNPPFKLPIWFEWKSRHIEDEILWFQNESDQALNSNPYQAADIIIHKYFPGEVTANLRKIVVEKILEKTKQINARASFTCNDSTLPSSKNSSSLEFCEKLQSENMKEHSTSTASSLSKTTSQVVDSKQTCAAKKRPSDGLGGAVPKQRSQLASLAAAAAISRAEGSHRSDKEKTSSHDRPSTPTASQEKPMHMVRLGPGFSIMAASPGIPSSQKLSNQDLVSKCHKTSELLLDCLGLLSNSVNRNNSDPQKECAKNRRTVAPKGSEPSYGSLSQLAQLFNVGEAQSCSDNLSDDYISWGEDENSM